MNQTTKKIMQGAAILLLAAGFAACTNNDTIEINPEQPATVTATVTAKIVNDNQTRIEYVEGINATKVKWSATEEKFSVLYAGGSSTYTFTKPVGDGETFAAASVPEPNVATTYHAVYFGNTLIAPVAMMVPAMVTYDWKTQNGKATNKHLLVASVTGINSWEDAEFVFQHKTATVKLTLKNDDFGDEDISDIKFTATNLKNAGTYLWSTQALTPSINAESTISVSESITADAEGNCVVYLAMPPQDLAGIEITATCGGNTYTGTIANNTIVAGNMYQANVVMAEEQGELVSMEYTILTTEADQEVSLPFTGQSGSYTLYVNWGDGSEEYTVETLTNPYDLSAHTYTTPGTYVITISSTQTDYTVSQVPAMKFGSDIPLFSMDTPILRMEAAFGLDSFKEFFNGSPVTSVHADLLMYHADQTDFENCFRNTKLTSIPTGLFDYNTGATSFKGCFYQCTSLTSVPELLFEKHTATTIDFSECFMMCSNLALNANVFCDEGDPTNLAKRFDEKTVNFHSCFRNCGSGVPPTLWEYTYGGVTSTRCFYGANSITGYSSIPTDWKSW